MVVLPGAGGRGRDGRALRGDHPILPTASMSTALTRSLRTLSIGPLLSSSRLGQLGEVYVLERAAARGQQVAVVVAAAHRGHAQARAGQGRPQLTGGDRALAMLRDPLGPSGRADA
jgi:hypothetical protein